MANVTKLLIYSEDCPRFGWFGSGLACRMCPEGVRAPRCIGAYTGVHVYDQVATALGDNGESLVDVCFFFLVSEMCPLLQGLAASWSVTYKRSLSPLSASPVPSFYANAGLVDWFVGYWSLGELSHTPGPCSPKFDPSVLTQICQGGPTCPDCNHPAIIK